MNVNIDSGPVKPGPRGQVLSTNGPEPLPCSSVALRSVLQKVPQVRCNSTDVGSIPGCGIGVRTIADEKTIGTPSVRIAELRMRLRNEEKMDLCSIS